MFTIDTDPQRKLMRVVLTGSWDLPMVERFGEAREAAATKMGWRAGDYVCLADLRNYGVQTQAVAAHGRVISQNAATPPRRSAVLLSSALLKMQVARTAGQREEQAFASEEEGLAWLFEAP